MQRAQERETLAKATANAEAQAEAKKAAERWVALPKDAAVSDEDARGEKKAPPGDFCFFHASFDRSCL